MIEVVEVKNCRWANVEHTIIDCEVNFSHLDEDFVPFSAVQSGDTDYSHTIFANAIAGQYGAIAEYTPPPEPTDEEVAFLVRMERDKLLRESDWTQNADIPQALKDKWAPYRQALRDLPAQTGFPKNVVFPALPQ